jgi:hypothetical protein
MRVNVISSCYLMERHIVKLFVSSRMGMKVVLQPVTTNLDDSTLYNLAEVISKEFGAIEVTLASSTAIEKPPV